MEPTDEHGNDPIKHAAALRLIARLREFAATLDGSERALLATLLAPGITAAYSDAGSDDVTGFEQVEWSTGALPSALVEALRAFDVRIEFG